MWYFLEKCDAAKTCTGKGTCKDDDTCDCTGNYSGTNCNECKANFFGTDCMSKFISIVFIFFI